jgi:DUF1365 family protein
MDCPTPSDRPRHAPAPAAWRSMPSSIRCSMCSCRCAIWRRRTAASSAVDRANVLSFRQKDHGARDGSPLVAVDEALLREHGCRTMARSSCRPFPRVFGFVFNPVSFWYCHDRAGRTDRRAGRGQQHLRRHATATCCTTRTVRRCATDEELRADKVFHVSPFNEIEGGYRFRFHLDRPVPLARIDYDDAEGELLLTSISGKPQEWGAKALACAPSCACLC